MELKQAENNTNQSKKKISGIWNWIRFFVLLGICCLVVNNIVGLTLINGISMYPTLQNNNIVLLNKLSAHIGTPKYGDVAVINFNGRSIIKRVMALPGDTVAIQDGIVYVNGIPLPEIYTNGNSENMSSVKVGAEHIFVMGDNRVIGASDDSRDPSIGALPISSIQGYAEFSLIPFERIAKPLKF